MVTPSLNKINKIEHKANQRLRVVVIRNERQTEKASHKSTTKFPNAIEQKRAKSIKQENHNMYKNQMLTIFRTFVLCLSFIFVLVKEDYYEDMNISQIWHATRTHIWAIKWIRYIPPTKHYNVRGKVMPADYELWTMTAYWIELK